MQPRSIHFRIDADLAAALDRHCQRWQCNTTEAITRVLAASWGVPVVIASKQRRRAAQQRRRAREASKR
jgi:hypothetical protein